MLGSYLDILNVLDVGDPDLGHYDILEQPNVLLQTPPHPAPVLHLVWVHLVTPPPQPGAVIQYQGYQPIRENIMNWCLYYSKECAIKS